MVKKILAFWLLIALIQCGCKELDECAESNTKKEVIIKALRHEKKLLQAKIDYSSSTNDDLRDRVSELKVKNKEKQDEIDKLMLKRLQLKLENKIMKAFITDYLKINDFNINDYL